MEIEGKIIAVLPQQSGVSSRTGNPWASQDYVIETHEQYPRKCCFRVFGADKIQSMAIKAGEELRVSFDIDAHEYNGRWYNNLTAWKVDRVDAAAAAAAQPPVAAAASQAQPQGAQAPFPPAPEGDNTDDLPF